MSKQIYEFSGDHRNCFLKLKNFLSILFRAWLKYFDTSGLDFSVLYFYKKINGWRFTIYSTFNPNNLAVYNAIKNSVQVLKKNNVPGFEAFNL